MNVNNFYREVFEDSLGLDVLGLENRFSDLVRLIERKTIMAFSNLIPATYRTVLDLADPHNIIKKEHHTLGVEYYIDDPVLDMFNLAILEVTHMEPCNVGNRDPYDPDSSAYYSSLVASRQNMTLEGVLMGSQYTTNRTLIDSSIPFKPYKELRGPRTLYLRNCSFNTCLELTLKVPWPNIVSIPEEYRETFITLAKLDIKIKLWNELRYMEDVVTPTGNLNLRVSDWESAEKEREEFLKELKLKSLPDRVGPSYFHIL